MKCSYFLYSVLLLLVLGGCCNVDTSPIKLTSPDLGLLANQVGDTIKLKDNSTNIVYQYIIDSVGTSMETRFNGLPFFAEDKAKCPQKERVSEVGKVVFEQGGKGYRFARTTNSELKFKLNLSNIKNTLFFTLSLSNDSDRKFIKYHSNLTINQLQFNDVYEIFSSSIGSSEYIRILISQKEGLIFVEDTSNNTLLSKL